MPARPEQIEGINAFFRDAYKRAVAPLVAGAIHYAQSRTPSRKTPLNILVISRKGNRLPQLKKAIERELVKKSAEANADFKEIGVLELLKLENPRIRFKEIGELKQLVGNKRFDIVVGLEVADHPGKELMPDFVERISGLMTDNGFFIHSQDWPPDMSEWAPHLKERAGIKADSFTLTENEAQRNAMRTATQEAHHAMLDALKKGARVKGMKYGECKQHGEIEGSPETLVHLEPVGAPVANSYYFDRGFMEINQDDKVPEGWVRKAMTTSVAVVAKERDPNQVIQHLRDNGFLKEPPKAVPSNKSRR